MNVELFYDTETTGLPLFNLPSEDPGQPHIVQLAGALVDMEAREVIASIDLIIKPDGWEIPAEVSAIHGITTEHALAVGVPEADAIRMFLQLWGQRVRIAHNEKFDARLIRIAQMRHELPLVDEWKAGAAQCTQIITTPIVKAPPTAKMIAANRHHYKSANLGEAYEFFFGKPLVNAHSAMADVNACIDVYFAAQDVLAGAKEAA